MSQSETVSFENMVVSLGRVGIIILAIQLPHRDVKVCAPVFLKGFEWLL